MNFESEIATYDIFALQRTYNELDLKQVYRK